MQEMKWQKSGCNGTSELLQTELENTTKKKIPSAPFHNFTVPKTHCIYKNNY